MIKFKMFHQLGPPHHLWLKIKSTSMINKTKAIIFKIFKIILKKAIKVFNKLELIEYKNGIEI